MQLQESLKKLSESLQACQTILQEVSDFKFSGTTEPADISKVLEAVKLKLSNIPKDELINQDAKLFFNFSTKEITFVDSDWLRIDKILMVIEEALKDAPSKQEFDIETFTAGKSVPELTAGKADGLTPDFIPDPPPVSVKDFPYDPDEQTDIIVGDNVNDWDEYK